MGIGGWLGMAGGVGAGGGYAAECCRLIYRWRGGMMKPGRRVRVAAVPESETNAVLENHVTLFLLMPSWDAVQTGSQGGKVHSDLQACLPLLRHALLG